MSKLGAALYWAARGFRVFPIASGTKNAPLVSHSTEATTDAAMIRAWWQDPVTGAEHDHNVGISTTDMVVVDLDTRHGKNGLASYLAAGGALDTLTVRTPSGGLHLYYDGPDSATVANLLGTKTWHSGIDIRSHAGYVVASGSRTTASEYSVEGDYTVALDLPVARVPTCIATRLRPPLTRATAGSVQLDETPGLIAAATSFLASCGPAIQGAGGDQRTYQTACRLRDLGVSETGALALMLLHWNDRCSPPWDADELSVKVNNAYSYATGTAGSMAPELLFSGNDIPPPPEPPKPTQSVDSSFAHFGNAVSPNEIPARAWLYTRLLMRQQITMLTGGGAAGKSTMALTIAAHMALGRDFLNFKLRGGPQRSIIYNREDDVIEMSRRLWALCQWYGLPYDEVKQSVALVSRREFNLKLTQGRGNTIAMHTENCVALAKAAAQPGIGMIALDPLVSIHSGKEDDNDDMAFVMDILHAIIEEADVAALVLRHTRKTDGRISQAGETSAARGASSIGYAARFDYTMWTPTRDECEQFGIAPDRRFDFVRLDDGKMNYAKQQGLVGWFKKEAAKLPAGDEVGVLAPYDMTLSTDTTLLSWATIVAAEMKGAGKTTATLNEAANMLKAGDALASKLPAEVLRTRVKTALGSPRDTPSGRLMFTKIMHSGKLVDTIVLE